MRKRDMVGYSVVRFSLKPFNDIDDRVWVRTCLLRVSFDENSFLCNTRRRRGIPTERMAVEMMAQSTK